MPRDLARSIVNIVKKLTMLSLPAVLAIASIAGASDTQLKPYSFKIGFSYLGTGDSRDFTTANGLICGFGYDLPVKSLLSQLGGVSSLELEYQRHVGNGNRLDAYSLSYVERVPFTLNRENTGPVPYYGFGVGVFLNGGKLADAVPIGVAADGLSAGDSFTKWTLGGQILVGLNFEKNAFVEASYRMSGAVEGLKTDSINLMVGVRF